jgi:hypothetical protein
MHVRTRSQKQNSILFTKGKPLYQRNISQSDCCHLKSASRFVSPLGTGTSKPVSKFRVATGSSSKSLAVFTSLAKFFGDESSSDADLPFRASVCKVTHHTGEHSED